jgi:hypothetical protein
MQRSSIDTDNPLAPATILLVVHVARELQVPGSADTMEFREPTFGKANRVEYREALVWQLRELFRPSNADDCGQGAGCYRVM